MQIFRVLLLIFQKFKSLVILNGFLNVKLFFKKKKKSGDSNKNNLKPSRSIPKNTLQDKLQFLCNNNQAFLKWDSQDSRNSMVYWFRTVWWWEVLRWCKDFKHKHLIWWKIKLVNKCFKTFTAWQDKRQISKCFLGVGGGGITNPVSRPVFHR